jgi:hypothetical protein
MLLDFTAGYHQTPLDPDSQEYTAFITQYGLFEWNRVAMGLKGSDFFFQRSMANIGLSGYVTRICEIYIDDVLLLNKYLDNTRKVLVRPRGKKVTSNPAKTRLGLKEVEYVGHLISSTGTSFTEEKRLQVLDFPLPETEKALLQFIGLANYFRDHVPNMTEMFEPLRKLMNMKKYKGSKKLTWTEEAIEAFHFCRIAVSNCQELYFLEDAATPTTVSGDIQYVHDSGSSSTSHHMILSYINVTFTDKVLRWKLYLQGKDFDLYLVSGKEKHQLVSDALSRLCVNSVPPPPTLADKIVVTLKNCRHPVSTTLSEVMWD